MQALRFLTVLVLAGTLSAPCRADPGTLIPLNLASGPDPSILSLARMSVELIVDERFARVRTRQVFANHTGRELEGEYVFFLPAGTSLADFAIWEDGARIPGVVLERARARMHYESLTANKVDPGLLEKSEHAEESNTFSVKVFPIPAWGSKRIELEYTAELAVAGRQAQLVYPLKPARYRSGSAAELSLAFRVESVEELAGLKAEGLAFPSPPRHTASGGSHVYEGSFTGRDVGFESDFTLSLSYRPGATRTRFQTYREPGRVRRDLTPFGAGKLYSDERGYFQAETLFDLEGDAGGEAAAPSQRGEALAVSIALDCSLSMQWQKLEGALSVVEGVLLRLAPSDSFALLAFNDRVRELPGGLRPATAASTAAALEHVRGMSLAGGTDLARALEAGLRPLAAAPKGARRLLVLVTDGHATSIPVGGAALLAGFEKANGPIGASVMAFGVGSDANRLLLSRLSTASTGQFTWASESEDIRAPLATFLGRMGEAALRNLTLAFEVPENIEMVYPAGTGLAYDRSSYRFIGRYKGPLGSTGVAVSFESPSGPRKLQTKVELPESTAAHAHLPRVWARERVDWLLEQISLQGEREDWIEEIIALAREHRFVTPYTSFLAAPRALLRPRVIKPGDPVLRVKTPQDIAAVTAIFPFGLTRALAPDGSSGLWETRFLVPHAMADGIYRATLVLTHRDGRKFLEEKSFVIDSRPPELSLGRLGPPPAAGETLELVAYADSDTRRITARLPGLPPVELRYDAKRHASTALVRLPSSMAPGAYPLRLTAEDFAHNISFTEEQVVVR